MDHITNTLLLARLFTEVIALALRLGVSADAIDAAIARAKADGQELNAQWQDRRNATTSTAPKWNREPSADYTDSAD